MKINNFEKSKNFSSQIHRVIPGGAHTYSKGDDQFPQNSPGGIIRGEGAYVWDLDENKYIDTGMGLTSVSIGHGYYPVAKAVSDAAFNGVNFQRPSIIELEAANLFLETVDAGDMVKFAKNGSTVTSAAYKLARAYTGRSKIAICGDHNFFSYDDWFISTTLCDHGTLELSKNYSVKFNYNDVDSILSLFKDKNHDIACLILEPVKFDEPKNGFLHDVVRICKENKVVLIFDEMISGFKWGLGGAQQYFGVKSDLTTWGKGIANGFSACALTGSAEIMELGGIRNIGAEKLFLISTTHGAETTGLAALISTINEFKSNNMIDENWRRAGELLSGLRGVIHNNGLENSIQLLGYECLFLAVFKDWNGNVNDGLRTLFMQEMISNGVLFQGIFYTTWSHQPPELAKIIYAFNESCKVYKMAIESQDLSTYLIGPAVKPVFRKKI